MSGLKATDFSLVVAKLLTLIQIFVFFEIGYSIIGDKGNISLKHIIITFIISVILVIIYGIVTTPSGVYSLPFRNRLASVAGDPNILAFLCTFAYIFSLHFFISEKGLTNKVLAFAAMLFLICATIRTQSRQGVVLAIAGTILYFIIYYILKFRISTEKSKLFFKSIIILLATILIICIGFQFFKQSEYYYRFSTFINFLKISQRTSAFPVVAAIDLSTFMRVQLIRYGLEMWKDNPVMGVGLDNFRVNIKGYWHAGLPLYSHNNYIELLSTIGIFGVISYYALYFYVLTSLFSLKKEYYSRRENFSAIVLLITTMFTLMVAELFTVTYYTKYSWILITIVCAYREKFESVVDVES
jgi:O-antigen ligase